MNLLVVKDSPIIQVHSHRCISQTLLLGVRDVVISFVVASARLMGNENV